MSLNIKNENTFEIRPATSQDRIQKKKKLEESAQLMPANVKVIKKVVVQFCSNRVRCLLWYNPVTFTLIQIN
ncbi:hypothetical protein D0809_08150 [Flavobacterium circumlabens]|uniref:Uncharacterized protein n=1 Tax=Flavobacterium circumlabens TaxID=2133765 RepID=A0A4Y7UFE0_9FLAO|nr:hypothetical protein D0809_08150 [Flavobacterium circumlabens]